MSVLLPTVGIDAAELELLGFTKDSEDKEALAYQGSSQFLRAFNQTPVDWSQHRSLLQNLHQYAKQFWNQGRTNLRQAYGDKLVDLSYQPQAASWNYLRELAQGQDSVLTHPLDRAIAQL